MVLRKTLKFLLSIILVLLIVVTIAYTFQDPRTGRGSDTTTKYSLVNNWLRLPLNIRLGDPVGLAVDTHNNLIVFHRAGREWPLVGQLSRKKIADNTILVIDSKTGAVIGQWGANLFAMPHGLSIDPEDNIWVTDVALHMVFKFSPYGKLLLRLGTEGEAGSDASHFNQPTDVAVDSSGSVYVTDGYGNSRVVKFSAAGRFILQFGRKGHEPGEFDIPHGLGIDSRHRLYVADRENSRLQIFDTTGVFIKQLHEKSFGNFCGVYIHSNGTKIFAVDDHSFWHLRHRGSDVFVFDSAGSANIRFGRSGGIEMEKGWYHDLAVDSTGSIYVGDILNDKILKFVRVH